MKKFEFSLGRILDYKDQVLETEKNTLMQLNQKLARIEAAIKSLQWEFSDLNDTMQEETKKGITMPKLRGYEYQMQSVRRLLREREDDKKLAELLVASQLKVVIAASQEVSGLDKLEEKQREEYRIMEAKVDETAISEYVMGKLARRKEA